MRIGVDVGKARIGIARSDLHGMLATPLETVHRAKSGEDDVARIVQLVRELDAVEVVVGLPLGLSGHRTPSTEDAESFARRISVFLSEAAGDGLEADPSIPVRMLDERLSTVAAQGQLRQAGKRTKQTRGIIDQAAAVVILQHALDSERALGAAPGTLV